MVAREVQCDGRMAMGIERARVQNRLHPLMVSVPESVPVAGHGARSGGEIVVVLFNPMNQIVPDEVQCGPVPRGRDPVWSHPGWRVGD